MPTRCWRFPSRCSPSWTAPPWRARSSCHVPLLAPEVVELAWSLPLSARVGDEAAGKAVLRAVVERRVGPLSRTKQGFDPPLGQWLRGPLRPWAEDHLDERAIRASGVLRADTVMATWRQVLRGDDRGLLRIWSVLALRSWAAANGISL